mmetsp:Transcript_15953/g.45690  ORF Transcript_15953/g.45690 Transcript_15953/m.45690 type:complete len:196 (-) Transcript_15953:257-844(-)
MMQALKTKVNFVSSSRATGKMRTGSTVVASAAPHKNIVADVARTSAMVAIASVLAVSSPVGVEPAMAGVQMYKTEVKNLVKNTEPAKKPKAAPGTAAAKPKKANENAGDPDAFDVKVLALPLCFGAVLGLYFALAAIDPGFLEFMEEASTKDSRGFAGYETGLKNTPFFGGDGDVPRAAGGSAKKAAPKKKRGLF